VVVHAATKTKHTYETLYDGWGGWGWRRWGGGFGGATTYVNDFKVGTVVVDMFDARSKQAVWHGSATDALSDNAAGWPVRKSDGFRAPSPRLACGRHRCARGGPARPGAAGWPSSVFSVSSVSSYFQNGNRTETIQRWLYWRNCVTAICMPAAKLR
jgi:uncharacterized protein DUF4136